MEDGPRLRELVIAFINEAGFVALEAGDADEAIGLLKARPDIAVLLTDINMPGSMVGGVSHGTRPLTIDKYLCCLRPGPAEPVRFAIQRLSGNTILWGTPDRPIAPAARFYPPVYRSWSSDVEADYEQSCSDLPRGSRSNSRIGAAVIAPRCAVRARSLLKQGGFKSVN